MLTADRLLPASAALSLASSAVRLVWLNASEPASDGAADADDDAEDEPAADDVGAGGALELEVEPLALLEHAADTVSRAITGTVTTAFTMGLMTYLPFTWWWRWRG